MKVVLLLLCLFVSNSIGTDTEKVGRQNTWQQQVIQIKDGESFVEKDLEQFISDSNKGLPINGYIKELSEYLEKIPSYLKDTDKSIKAIYNSFSLMIDLETVNPESKKLELITIQESRVQNRVKNTLDVINYAVKWIQKRLRHVSHKKQKTTDLLTSIRKELWNYDFKIQTFSESLRNTVEQINLMENDWYKNMNEITGILKEFTAENIELGVKDEYQKQVLTLIENFNSDLLTLEFKEIKKALKKSIEFKKYIQKENEVMNQVNKLKSILTDHVNENENEDETDTETETKKTNCIKQDVEKLRSIFNEYKAVSKAYKLKADVEKSKIKFGYKNSDKLKAMLNMFSKLNEKIDSLTESTESYLSKLEKTLE